MKFRYILISLLFVTSLRAASQSDLTFTQSGNAYTLSDCDESASGSLIIPSSFDGLPVKYIGMAAFSNCTGLTNVTIPDSVISIGLTAFSGCTSLNSINIPSSVTSIAMAAFMACSSLTDVTIPNSVTRIPMLAFAACTSLTSVTIPDSVTSIGDSAFSGCSSLASITFEGDAPSFGSDVFLNSDSVTLYYNSNNGGWSSTVAGRPAVQTNTLTFALNGAGTQYSLIDCIDTYSSSLLIPDTFRGLPVTSIGDGAFAGCTNVPYFFIPNGVISIGDGAFESCTSLTSMTIQINSVTTVGARAFYNCSNLTNITFISDLTSIGDFAFEGCTSLTRVVFGDTVTSIGQGAFLGTNISYGHTADTSISFGYTADNLNYIISNSGQTAYLVDGASASGVVNIPTQIPVAAWQGDSVTAYVKLISSGAFAGTSLTSITIPDSVTTIGDDAFSDCSSLTSITFEGDAPTFGSDVFTGSDSATVYYDSHNSGWSATVAGRPAVQTNTLIFTLNGDNTEYSVSDCLTSASGSLEIPSVFNGLPVTSIGVGAFGSCASLTSISIGNGVTSIERSAFYGCSSLTSIIIPDSVTSVEDGTFESCTSLTSATIGDSVTSIGEDAFNGCSSLTSINIPDSVTSIGVGAFNGCSSLTSITVGDNLTSIAKKVFSGTNISYDYTADNLNYLISRSGQSAYLIDGASASGAVNIPNQVNTAYVKLIRDGAFASCTSLTSITIPDSVTSIGEDAFYDCTSLTSITIGNGVTSIAGRAFYGCSSLTSITFEGDAPTFGSDVFTGSDSATVYYDSHNSGWSATVAGRPAVQTNTLIFTLNGDNTEYSVSDCLTSASGSLEIPSVFNGLPVTSIGGEAFYNCSSLTSVTIPDSIISIGDGAFLNCSDLNSITIPDSVTSIGYGAFDSCASLTSISIGNGVTSIERSAFNGCSSLNSISIGNGVTSIERGAFYGCSSLTSINIPDSVTSIGVGAFDSCASLTSITVGDNLISIGELAFTGTNISYDYTADNLNYLISRSGQSAYLIDGASASGVVNIPNQVNTAYVKFISSLAFHRCYSLTTITIPDSVTSIGEGAFATCTNLASVTIGNGVTSIAAGGFYGCYSLTSINIPDSVASIGEYAFARCNSLISITISNGMTSIERATFSGCYSLTSITIPDSVTTIGEYAFEGCSSLTSITIPESVTSIAMGAFAGCSSLTSIAFDGDAPTFGTDVFSGSDSATVYYDSHNSGWSNTVADRPAVQINTLTFALNNAGTEYNVIDCSETASGSLDIPNTYKELPVTSIGEDAFRDNSLTSITIPDSVTSIGVGAFYDCSSLTSITVGDNLTSIARKVFSGTNISYDYTADNLNYLISRSGQSAYLIDGASASGAVNIPNQVNTAYVKLIRDGAFASCTSLTSITIPDSVTSIGEDAFYNCTSLTSITIGNGVTSIAGRAFYGCSSLTSITIPDSVTSIGGNAFDSAVVYFSRSLLEAAESALATSEAEKDARPTQAAYDEVVAERNARPTQAAYDAVVAERDARITQSEVRDLRLGSSMLEVVDGDASINIELEATDNLGITSPTWTPVPESKVIIHPNYQSGKIKIDVKADDESNSGVRFFRFKMDGSNSSSDDIKLSIGESEYDETAVREALAEQYGVPLELISLTITSG